jgi:hypothetical protein
MTATSSPIYRWYVPMGADVPERPLPVRLPGMGALASSRIASHIPPKCIPLSLAIA